MECSVRSTNTPESESNNATNCANIMCAICNLSTEHTQHSLAPATCCNWGYNNLKFYHLERFLWNAISNSKHSITTYEPHCKHIITNHAPKANECPRRQLLLAGDGNLWHVTGSPRTYHSRHWSHTLNISTQNMLSPPWLVDNTFAINTSQRSHTMLTHTTTLLTTPWYLSYCGLRQTATFTLTNAESEHN